MSLKRIGIILAAFAGLAYSQTFEVASVKPSGPGSSDPGRYRCRAASLLDLIATAYNVEYFQVSSPAPLDRQLFDLVARVPEGATKQEFRTMLQNLLAERFSLRLHIQSKEFPAYELVVAKTGARLTEAAANRLQRAAEDGFPNLPPDRPGMAVANSVAGAFELSRMRSRQEPISLLAKMLRPADGLPVVDKTGLAGKYDFTLEYTRELPNAAPEGLADPPVAPNLFTALEQQLSLQLVRKKVPFDVVIVESFNPQPADN